MNHPARTLLITGASGNLGRAVARHFRAHGERLILLDHSPEALQQQFGDWPPAQALCLNCDLLDPAALDAALGGARQHFGPIEVLCNLAGGFDMGPPVHATPLHVWQRQYQLNLLTALHACQAVVPDMLTLGRGKIVNIGALAAAHKGAPHMAAYTTAKTAVIRMTESLAAELREQGINVNCVLPSIIDTPQNRAAMPDADPTRWVAPEQLAAIIGFLCSEAAAPIHGAALPVSGLS
ncbi:SDR family NAD(P)-dependent oxidoreductase [Vandammella animalimorsus]|uniref:SDR family NAD(P)-dependent oxidoreductase n=1 Tax=Vandammella animalimorsus TaxID=2029117 RepID=A0A3M6R6P3_9BURK|nr:SDR family NAD(P)-dependent oxidoreductase [Vandammella animalimorsus]RMX11007.1 SDR family NAD(P)-dependent oxidoreductase [Vandammella animalimorsus]